MRCFPACSSENLTPIIEKNVAQGLRGAHRAAGVTGINYIEINLASTTRTSFPR